MKKNYFLLALLFISSVSFSQDVLLLNGGVFSNSAENGNLVRFNFQNSNTGTLVDSIRTASVQELIVEGDFAYAAAQDSIIKFDLVNNKKIAAAAFPGISTKSLEISGNVLLAGNWFAQTSNNLYLFDKNSLAILDTIQEVSKGAKSIHVNNGFAYINQNSGTANFTDTLGYIIRFDVANRTITDTINVPNYTQDIGELIPNPNGSGFYSLNSGSNTITTIDYATLTATNTAIQTNLRVSSRSHYSIQGDTLFARAGKSIDAINLNGLSIIDTNLVDTVVTAFTYDTANTRFYVTQTNFSGFKAGRVYNRAGARVNTFAVGFSPEVITMYYNQAVGLNEFAQAEVNFKLYPNPTNGLVNLTLDSDEASMRIFNMKGQVLIESLISNRQTSFDLSELTPGLYFLEVNEGNRRSTQRLIIQ